MKKYKLKREVTYRGKVITVDSIIADGDMEKEVIEKLIKKDLVEKIVDKEEKSVEIPKDEIPVDDTKKGKK